MKQEIKSRRRGYVLWYTLVMMTALCLFASLGADYGRVQLAKTQLRRVADASARAGADALLTSNAQAVVAAQKYAGLNLADGKPVLLDATQDIEFGTWNRATSTFSALSGFSASLANAVHITARRTSGRGNAVPLLFASVGGVQRCDVKADAIAMVIPPVNVNQYVPATANPFLAGMPPGSVASLNNPHNSPDYAGNSINARQSPLSVNMPISDGQVVTFDSISGDARHDPSLAYFSPDGQLNDIGHNTNGSENGIADMKSPINALVGLFLDDNQPNTTSAPPALDFSTSASRDFISLSPKLKQIFFIGDGLNSQGNQQSFVVPKGATRLYLATWDFYEWNNNAGSRNIKVTRPEQIITVK